MTYLQGFLIQCIIYFLIWYFNEYLGLLICLIMSAITGGILIFALIAEMVDKSKVPRSYFKWMLTACIAPAIVAIFVTVLYQGNFDWLRE